MRWPLGAALLCLAVAACGAEGDVREPGADEPAPSSMAAATSAALPDVLEVRCLGDGTSTVATPRVRPGRAGVLVRVVNQTDGVRAVMLDADRLGITADQEPGTTVESMRALRPGPVGVHCTTPGTAATPATIANPVSSEVVDVEGLWRPDAVECPGHDELGIPPQAGWTAYPPLTREQLPDELRNRARLAPDDEIQPGGYPEQENAPLVVVRDGRVVLSAVPTQVDGGGWDFAEIWGCESDGLLDLAADEAMPADVVTAEATSVAAEAVEVADVAEVHCTNEGTTVPTQEVLAGPEGVRVRVVNDADEPMSLVLPMGRGGSAGDLAPGETRESVETFAPGPVAIACYDPEDPAQDPPSSPGYLKRVASFEVVDPLALWQPTAPECPDGNGVGIAGSFGPDAGMPREDLPAAIRERAHLQPEDEIRSGGYPAQADAPIIVLRDGRVILSAMPVKLDHGWEIGSMEGCTADGLIG